MTHECNKETELALIKQSMKNIHGKLDDIKISLEKLEWKYAWKWTEKVLIFIGATWWSSIVGSIMYLILK